MSAPVLIFDSGVGGLSVVGALRQQLPTANLVYVCDNAALPYGTKPDAWLVKRIVAVCQAAVTASGAGVLVVACNTASTLALKALRARLSIPVVGTVPAIKPAAALSESGVIGLLATSATVTRSYTDGLIRDFADGCSVVRVAADDLVEQAERRFAGLPVDEAVLKANLVPLWRAGGLDTVVLGCTHFPLLQQELGALAPRSIQWVDSCHAIARRVAQVFPDPRAAPANVEQPGFSWSTGTVQPGLIRGLHAFGFATPAGLVVPAAKEGR